VAVAPESRPLRWRGKNLVFGAPAARNRRGQPQKIEDGQLRQSRDHLVWLLESTWGYVGWKLRKVRTAADVQLALESWTEDHGSYTASTLLRPNASPATAKSLNTLRRRLSDYGRRARTAYEYQEQCREALERADRAASQLLSQKELGLINRERQRRAEAYANAKEDYLSLARENDSVLSQLHASETYFALNEVLRFCRSRRYALVPLNIANAFAGLPFIGWRQSAKRCAAWECPMAGGINSQIFDAIVKITRTCAKRAGLHDHAERWLRSSRSKSQGIAQLKETWYYFHRAIETIAKSNPSTRALPYLIFSEYRRRTAARTAVDLLFEEEERLGISP
jgi:hypothetical protein